ncbi:hypothetical protein [Streptacidiphilus rugosus]|uniref:hypothetical protein n=1 Tax=Streptacidiphilus rugosus TaxID=405783 RepID=UPI00068D4F55|nr:hypothetical protein [Streptacidiphilus rugosus]
MRKRPRVETPDSHAFPTRPYDLVKEAVIALIAVTLLTFGLATLFSSPNEKPVTIATWSKADPADFTATAVGELGGTSSTAQYGPPYNTAADGQKLGPLYLQKWAGVRHPIDTAHDFVVQPLQQTPEPAVVTAALARWDAASADQQAKWTAAYADALGKAPNGDPAKVAPGDYGPVPVLTARLLELGRSGTLDAQLLAEGHYFQTDYTRALLFLADGSYLEDQARAQHLGGDQWGMMNETGNYPGQAWLWLYTFWYQIDPYKSSGNADALVWGTMALLSALLLLVPFIPGLRDIPRLTRVYRLIWRDWYRDHPNPGAGAARTST